MTVFSLGGTAGNDIHGHKFVNSPEQGVVLCGVWDVSGGGGVR